MKKNNGFTLVELLAVIVILAIIMIIAIPSVLNIVTTGRIKSFETYAKKAVLATEQKNTEEEMMQVISGKGIYTYNIKEDLDLSNTGSYEGYIVVDDCTQEDKQYYVYLADGENMAYDFLDKDNAKIIESENFKTYNEEEWKSKAGSKEIVAGAVVAMTGGYTCALYGKDASEVLGEGKEVPNLPGSSNSAVFMEGVDVNNIMLHDVAGNEDFVIEESGGMRWSENIKHNDRSGKYWTKITQLADKTVKAVKKANSITEAQKSSAKIVSTSDSPNPIYMWMDSGTVYWYTDATKVFANKNASQMFSWLGAIKTIDLSGIDFSQTTDISYLFNCDISITSLDVSSMNVINVTNMTEVFYALESLPSIDITMWNTRNVTEVYFMFAYLKKATSIKFPKNLVNKKVIGMDGLFFEDNVVKSLDVSGFDTSNISSFYGIFKGCKAITTIDISNWNTSKATKMDYLFMQDEALTSVNLSNFDTSNVTDMYGMFGYTKSLKNINLSNFNTSNVTNMSYMFYGSGLTSLDLSNFNTSNVDNMEYMFYTAKSLKTLNLSNFDVSKVTTFEAMFGIMSALTTLDLSNWHLGSNVIATNMFRQSTKLKTIYVSESWKNHIGTDTNMFLQCNAIVGGNGTKYSSTVNKSRAVIDGEDGQKGYFTKKNTAVPK